MLIFGFTLSERPRLKLEVNGDMYVVHITGLISGLGMIGFPARGRRGQPVDA